MHPFLTFAAVVATCLSRANSAGTMPVLNFAVNAQIPPVAYALRFFEFTFSADTFRSSSARPLAYQITNAPSWLTIDSDSRTLFGTPTTTDVGAATLQLVAEDEGGQVADSVTLIVLRDGTLTTGEDILPQLQSIGSTSAPAALLLKPLTPFSFAFSTATFTGVSAQTRFYAVSADRSPLPSWLQFDPLSISFSGTTPPLPATTPSKQDYSLSLVASNVVGFSEAAVQFQLVIETHVLAFQQPRLTVDIANDGRVAVPALLSQLRLDSHAIGREYLTSVRSSAPDWLVLNDTDLSLAGVAPKDTDTLVFSVDVTGQDNNEANATIVVVSPDTLPVTQINLGVWNATRGKTFVHGIQRPLQVQEDALVTADLEPSATWLTFNTTSLVLSGLVPERLQPDQSNVSISFVSNSSTIIGTLVINVTGDEAVTSTTVTVSQTSDNAPVSPTLGPNDSTASRSPHSNAALGLKIGLPLSLTLVLICAIVCFLRYRSIRGPNTSKPDEGNNEAVNHDVASSQRNTIEVVAGEQANPKHLQLPDRVSQIRLTWEAEPSPNDKTLEGRVKGKARASDWDDLLSSSLISSQEDIATGLPMIRVPRKRQSTAALHRRSEIPHRWKSTQSSHHSRISTSSSAPSLSLMAIPKRMSGAGHGAGINPAIVQPEARSSWYTTFGSLPTSDSKRNTRVLSLFPNPPSHGNRVTKSTYTNGVKAKSRQKRRPVQQDSGGESSSFQEARQRYYTERAKDQLEGTARFSNSSVRSPTRLKPTSDPVQSITATGDSPSRARSGASCSKWSFGSGHVVPNMARYGGMLTREVSMASSGQFDSAVSSDSQWEDEELVAEGSTLGHRLSEAPPPVNQRQSQTQQSYSVGSKATPGPSRQATVSTDSYAKILSRSAKSQRGSFRFV